MQMLFNICDWIGGTLNIRDPEPSDDPQIALGIVAKTGLY